jgi:hypothetical protein
MSSLLALYSGDVSYSLHLHHYNVDNYDRDVIIIMNDSGQLNYIVVDRTKEKIIHKKSLPYLSKITNLLTKIFPALTKNALVLDKICGVYDDKDTGPFELVTLFFIMRNSYLNTNYVVQMNISNHDTKNTQLILIENHLNTKNVYLDMLVKDNVVYNDISTIKTTNTYLMFVDVAHSITGSIRNAHIKGLRLLVTDAEKEEFKSNFPDIELIDTYHPIVDIWSKQQIIFMQLTEDSKRLSFNFSTGMGFIEFEDD